MIVVRCSHCTKGRLSSSYDALSACVVWSCIMCGFIDSYIDIDGQIIRGGRAPNKGELLSIAHHNGSGR